MFAGNGCVTPGQVFSYTSCPEWRYMTTSKNLHFVAYRILNDPDIKFHLLVNDELLTNVSIGSGVQIIGTSSFKGDEILKLMKLEEDVAEVRKKKSLDEMKANLSYLSYTYGTKTEQKIINNLLNKIK
mgnify:CR=1 FL=1